MAPPVEPRWKPGTLKIGRGDWIRTSDPLRPRQVRYQAALRPDSMKTLILLPFRGPSYRDLRF